MYRIEYIEAPTHTNANPDDVRPNYEYTNKREAIAFTKNSVDFELFNQGPSTEFYDDLIHPGDITIVRNMKTGEIVHSITY